MTGKLNVLVDLLRQCGLVSREKETTKNKKKTVNHRTDLHEDNDDEEEDSIHHKAVQKFIIFAQNKVTINLIQRLVFDDLFPHAKVLRIDGSIPAPSRVSIAK
jgi:hypothetical protein